MPNSVSPWQRAEGARASAVTKSSAAAEIPRRRIVSRFVLVNSASSGQPHRARRLAAGLGDLGSICAVAAAASACCDCGLCGKDCGFWIGAGCFGADDAGGADESAADSTFN